MEAMEKSMRRLKFLLDPTSLRVYADWLEERGRIEEVLFARRKADVMEAVLAAVADAEAEWKSEQEAHRHLNLATARFVLLPDGGSMRLSCAKSFIYLFYMVHGGSRPMQINLLRKNIAEKPLYLPQRVRYSIWPYLKCNGWTKPWGQPPSFIKKQTTWTPLEKRLLQDLR